MSMIYGDWFNPSKFGSLFARYKFGEGLTLNDSRPEKWADISGKGRDFDMSDAAIGATGNEWRFDSSLNATVGGINTTYDNTFWVPATLSPLKNSLAFGRNRKVVVPAGAFSTVANQVSLAFSIIGSSDWPVDTSIIWCDNNSNTQRIINIHLPWNNGWVVFDCGNSGTSSYDRAEANNSANISNDRINITNWVFVKNATTGVMTIYRNGAVFASGTLKNRSMAGIARCWLGMETNNISKWAGRLVDFRVYDRALTDLEIAALPTESDPSMRVWYKFDETSGDVVNDSSGRAYHGSIVHDSGSTSVAYTTGYHGNAVNLKGDGNLNVKSSTVNLTTISALSCSIRLKTLGKDSQVLSRGGGTRGYSLYINTNGYPVLYWKPEGTLYSIVASINVSDNAWHSISFSVRNNEAYLMVDGVRYGYTTGTFPWFTSNASNTEKIGGDPNTIDPSLLFFGRRFVGQIDTIRMFRRYMEPWELAQVSRLVSRTSGTLSLDKNGHISVRPDKQNNVGIFGTVIAVVSTASQGQSTVVLLGSWPDANTLRLRQWPSTNKLGFTRPGVADYQAPGASHTLNFAEKAVVAWTSTGADNMLHISKNALGRSSIDVATPSRLPVSHLGGVSNFNESGITVFELIIFDTPLSASDELYVMRELMKQHGVP